MHRQFDLTASSRPIFLHDEVHDLLHHVYRLLLGHMVSPLRIQICFHSLTLKPRSARLSILFIVIRITPPYMRTRRALHFLAWTFGVAWGTLVAQAIWVCEKNPTWKARPFVIFSARALTAVPQTTPAPQCPLGRLVAIAQLISTHPLHSQFPASSLF